jgi:glycosyltransferase involved in cell wall biosynthesis
MTSLRILDAAMAGGTIALVGPEQDPDPELGALAHVRRLGAAPYEELPSLAAEADALMLPYADLDVTRAMQPLKMKEYLATGRPVVSTRLPALAGWEDCLDASDSPGEFARLVLLRAGTGAPEQQLAARERLRLESWQAKSARFAEVLFGD